MSDRSQFKVYTGADSRIECRIGEQFSIVLTGIPGAGYQWFLSTSPLVRLLKENVEPSQNVGGAATFRFQLEAVRQGSDQLEAQYRRSWERRNEDSVLFKLFVDK